jgi:hypothetical protein
MLWISFEPESSCIDHSFLGRGSKLNTMWQFLNSHCPTRRTVTNYWVIFSPIVNSSHIHAVWEQNLAFVPFCMFFKEMTCIFQRKSWAIKILSNIFLIFVSKYPEITFAWRGKFVYQFCASVLGYKRYEHRHAHAHTHTFVSLISVPEQGSACQKSCVFPL